MWREAKNSVYIVGILAETDIKDIVYVRNGMNIEALGGTIKVRVDTVINDEIQCLEIPVRVFQNKYTKAGAINKTYEKLLSVKSEMTSIAAAGSIEGATKISVQGTIDENDFMGRNGEVVSYATINGKFINKWPSNHEFVPCANFTLEFMVSSMNRVVDKEGVELDPPKLEVQVVVPKYTNENAAAMNVDVIKLYAVTPNVISNAENILEVGSCFVCEGRLNFSSKTEEVVQEMAFGEPKRRVRTTNVNELILTGGDPLDEEFGWSVSEIKNGVAARKARLEALKTQQTAKKAPVESSPKGKLDLGF